MAKKKYTFSISEGVFQFKEKMGQPYWSANMQSHFGSMGGFGCPCDTREEAEQRLYDYQDKHNIPDGDIEWVNIKPRVAQMELF